jgi:predicted metal-binding membrane protein
MSAASGHRLEHLPPAASGLGAIFARPKIIAMVCVVALSGLGWLTLGLQAGGWLDALCRQPGATNAAVVVGMWTAMILAMMLPTAAPMILTYTEIADTAARKNEPAVSPFAIAAGYTVVWLGFAAAAALTQLMLTRFALLDSAMKPASAWLSAAIFFGAGLYQFSALKHACLTQCQQPFSFFFANWKTTPRGVFGLGLRQGFYCLGCCWAMMLVMFAAGMMNVIWMAGLGIVMAIEKIGVGKRFSQLVGVALIAIGVAFIPGVRH